MTEAALTKALEAAGGTVALARNLRITSQAVSQWKRVPAERVLDVERATGVPRCELRPDLYPPEPAATPAPALAQGAA